MKLIAAKCPACGTSLAPGEDDLVVACEECRGFIQLADGDLVEIPIRFVSDGAEPEATRWLPYWVFEGEVRVIERTTHAEGSGVAASWEYWETRHRFFVPAWQTTTRAARTACRQMLEVEPRCDTIERPTAVSLAPVTLATADARQLLELTIVTVEAKRADDLKSLRFQLKVGDPTLWAMPEISKPGGTALPPRRADLRA